MKSSGASRLRHPRQRSVIGESRSRHPRLVKIYRINQFSASRWSALKITDVSLDRSYSPSIFRFCRSFGTMIRDGRYKLITYHGHELGELFDLENDPNEFRNLWDDPEYAEVRFHLMKKSFDALALAVDRGPEQVTRF